MRLRTVIRILNRPGGRALLGKLVTWKAHSTGGGGATIFFDDCWVHEFPDGSIAEWEPKDCSDAASMVTTDEVIENQ